VYLKGLTKEVVIATTESQKLPEFSEKGKAIMKILNAASIDTTYKGVLINAFSELLDEKLSAVGTTLPALFTAIVFTANTNGHSYPMNAVCIYDLPHNRCWTKNGTQGNSTPCDRADNSWRFATKEEIEAAFTE